jgi:flavin-dependent dehydrogenase
MRVAIIGAGNSGSTCAFMAAEVGCVSTPDPKEECITEIQNEVGFI